MTDSLPNRPHPPLWLLDISDPGYMGDAFAPDHVASAWLKTVFVDEAGPLFNEEHRHLVDANIGVLWTNANYNRKGKFVAGTAEIPKPGSTWSDARRWFQLEQWFGREEFPDFIITLHAAYCAQASDIEFCALAEHELLHCAQETDAFGAPRFTQEGGPKFGIRGHDIEEFTSVVARYGSTSEEMDKFIAAANKGPRVGAARIGRACGNCLARAA